MDAKAARESLFKCFNGIVFIEESHEYFWKDQKLPSVSTVKKRWEEKFDTKKMAFRCAGNEDYPGMTGEEVLQQWDDISARACREGSYAHFLCESFANSFLGKTTPLPLDCIGMPVEEIEVGTRKGMQGIRYIQFLQLQGWQIVETEVRMVNEEYGYTGMFDLLVFHPAYGFKLVDYKTSKTLHKHYGKLKGRLQHLDDHDFHKYSIQQSLYRMALEKAEIQTIGADLVHIMEDSYIVYEALDLRKEIIADLKEPKSLQTAVQARASSMFLNIIKHGRV